MMRVTLILFFAIGFLGNIDAQESVEMSLEDCINYALEHNEDIEIARLENEISVTQINETLAQGLPQVNGSIGVTRNFEIQTSFIEDFISPAVYGVLIEEQLLADGTQIPDPQTFPAAFGTEWAANAGITVSQLIFDGSYFVGLKAARTVKLLSQREQVQTEVGIIENVSKAYYLVLVTQANLEFLGKNFSTIDTLLRETSAMYESGFVEKIDVSRIKIQYNNLKTDLKNNTELLITAINLLKFQMGMPINTQIALTEKLDDLVVEMEEGNAAEAFQKRPEYAVLQTNRDLIDLNIKNFRSQYIPNLYANFNFGWTSGTNTFGDMTSFDSETWFRYSSLGINLSIPIFDGFTKRSVIQRNQIQRIQVEKSMDQFQNNVSREIIESEVNTQNAVREVASQKENVEMAEEVYNVTKVKYQEGLGSNYEVIEANTSLKESQTNYLNALYDAITAQIELKKALGILHNN